MTAELLTTSLPRDEDDVMINNEIPGHLEKILDSLATTGRTNCSWKELKRLIRWKLCKVSDGWMDCLTCIFSSREVLQVLDNYFISFGFIGPVTQSFESRKREILFLLDHFEDCPPFTLQRLVEVLQSGKTQYRSTHSIMNALVKLLSVSSYLDFEESMQVENIE